MFDNLTAFYETNQRFNPAMLNPQKEKVSKITGECLPYGKLKNLHIEQKDEGILMKGSLTKYYKGNNIENLNRKDTEYAIEKLSDDIRVDCRAGRVYSLEIAVNIFLKNLYGEYLEYFGDFQNNFLKKFTIQDSIYFENKTRKIKIYNKIPECKRKKQNIPENIKGLGLDIMRIELTLKKRLAKEFGFPVYIKSLYDKGFYIQAVNKLIDYYSKINKITKIVMNPDKYYTPKEYFDYMLIEYIQTKGLDNILSDIDNKRKKFNNSVQASLCKSRVKNDFEKDIVLQDKSLIYEIDDKILQLRNYR